jgi:hypothetical protein
MDLVKFYEKYYKKQFIFLFRECLTSIDSCAMIVSNKMDNCIAKSILVGISINIF